MEEFHEVRRGVGAQRKADNRRIQRWRKPYGNRLKANFNATYDVTSQRMGAGIIVRDRNGEVMASMVVPINDVTSPFIAECYAMWKAIEICTRLGFREVILEGDEICIVIDAVNNEEEDESWSGQIIDDIKK